MPSKQHDLRSDIDIVVQQVLGETVHDIEMPGGETRASCRVILKDGSVIATRRPNFRRTHLEAAVLEALSPVCPHVPKFLGLQDNILLQSDVGGQRLSQTIRTADPTEQARQAVGAVSAILSIHETSRTALRDVPVPPLGMTPDWAHSLADSVQVLGQMGQKLPFDADECAAALATEPKQFLKWDCRSGNAAIDASGTFCWFDFEYCGMRHGAEDFAWLIADESFPINPEAMFSILEQLLPAFDIYETKAFLNYLALYTTFHATQRLSLILSEAQRRGWRSKSQIVQRDDVGRHPEFAAHICRVGAFCASQHPLTRRLKPAFENCANQFEDMLQAQPAA